MTTIETSASSPSNAVRTQSFPVLEAGNISFPEGVYSVGFSPGSDRRSFTLNHRLRGAPLILRLLEEGRACYVCAVSSPRSSYRRTYSSDTPEQHISWDKDDLGEAPQFTPMIVSRESGDLTLDKDRDGLHDIWNGHRLPLVAGQKLAVGQVVHLNASVLQLLSLHADENLPSGVFVVDGNEEDGFYFHVRVSQDLHRFLRYGDKDPSRRNIMTHIVSACFSLLRREYASEDDEGGWRSFRSLAALADTLDGRGLPHWADDEFRPEEVATCLYPHVFSDPSTEQM